MNTLLLLLLLLLLFTLLLLLLFVVFGFLTDHNDFLRGRGNQNTHRTPDDKPCNSSHTLKSKFTSYIKIQIHFPSET